jgi:protein-disulfide isomerase
VTNGKAALMIRKATFGVVAALVSSGGLLSQANTACVPFTDELRETTIHYIRRLAKLPADVSLDLVRSALEADTCYRKLEFSVGGQRSKIILYLSPDQRFLSPQLFDLHIDPADAEAAETAAVSGRINSYLSAHKRPILGEPHAPVTIAVFSDFQCPFCKRAMEILTKEVFPSFGDHVRIVYLNYPLPFHSWGRLAAESTACLESPAVFWRLHDFVFAQQSQFNPNNFVVRTSDYLSVSSEIGSGGLPYKACLGSKEAATKVDDDIALAAELNVSSTPTLFVNGERLLGVKDADQIERLIRRNAKQ